MTREELLDRLPPCGLMCYTCPGFRGGAVQRHAAALLKLKEGFREFLGQWYDDLTELDQYLARLSNDAHPGCPGCRKCGGAGGGCIPGCFIPACAQERGVDFCAQCEQFPCQRVAQSDLYGEPVKRAFREGGELIRRHGPEGFFNLRKDTSHYLHYKQ
ncbi:MAG: DUF3795 domain-containing protein [Christensenellales bacterium]|jgi:hypothetical protein